MGLKEVKVNKAKWKYEYKLNKNKIAWQKMYKRSMGGRIYQ